MEALERRNLLSEDRRPGQTSQTTVTVRSSVPKTPAALSSSPPSSPPVSRMIAKCRTRGCVGATLCRLVAIRAVAAKIGWRVSRTDTMSLVNAAISALLQVVLLGGLPLFGYWIYRRRRYRSTFADTAARAGLQIGQARYLVYSLAFVVVGVAALIIWSPPLEPLLPQGSAQRQFVGQGLGVPAITRAFLYGVVQTGFTEELFFRGLIAGSLSRRLSLVWANLTQTFIFFLPHLAILLVAPDVWGVLPVVFLGALVLGWVRIKSGSILGPWLMHASGNVTMALMVAVRT